MEFFRANLSRFIVVLFVAILGVVYYKAEFNHKATDKKENVNFKVTSEQNSQDMSCQDKKKSEEYEDNKNEKEDACIAQDSDSKSSDVGSAMTEEKVRSIIKNYIENNPEVIIASFEKYQRDKEIDVGAESQRRIIEKKDDIDSIKNNTYSHIGSKNSEHTIIMFLDYNCYYCKRAGSIMNELVELDPKIKIAIQQYPILGETSSTIAKIVTYVSKNSPDKFVQVHNQMLGIKNPTEQDLREYVFKNSIGNFDEIMENKDVHDIIEKSKSLGSYVGIRGVPGFIIQDKLIPGLISIEQLRELIKEKVTQ